MLDNHAKLVVPHEVILLRHGETVWNRAGQIQGQLDSPLTPKGRDQARHQGALLAPIRAGLGAHQVYCSPLKRARDTAELALGAADYRLDDRLQEISCGSWEGTTDAARRLNDPQIVASHSAELDTYIHAPGGEGLEGLTARLMAFLRDLEGPTVVFSHKIALTVLRGLLSPQAGPLDTAQAPPQGSILRIRQGGAEVLV